jgi:hypothetical protein
LFVALAEGDHATAFLLERFVYWFEEGRNSKQPRTAARHEGQPCLTYADADWHEQTLLSVRQVRYCIQKLEEAGLITTSSSFGGGRLKKRIIFLNFAVFCTKVIRIAETHFKISDMADKQSSPTQNNEPTYHPTGAEGLHHALPEETPSEEMSEIDPLIDKMPSPSSLADDLGAEALLHDFLLTYEEVYGEAYPDGQLSNAREAARRFARRLKPHQKPQITRIIRSLWRNDTFEGFRWLHVIEKNWKEVLDKSEDSLLPYADYTNAKLFSQRYLNYEANSFSRRHGVPSQGIHGVVQSQRSRDEGVLCAGGNRRSA